MKSSRAPLPPHVSASRARRWHGWALLLVCLFAAQARGAREPGQNPPFIVTPVQVVERMLTLAKVGAEDTLMDLGSGDGRIVIHAAKAYGARAIGIELSRELVATSRENAARAGVAERVRFERGDVLAADLSRASVLTLYLGSELNERLVPRILAGMRPGSRVVSHDFALGNWAPDRIERLQVPEKNNGRGGESVLMLFVVPANAAGRWRAVIGEGNARRELEFSLAQQFQLLEGALHAAGASRDAPLKAALDGVRIAIDLPAGAESPPATVRARIDGDSMLGTLWDPSGAAMPFSARRIRARPDLY